MPSKPRPKRPAAPKKRPSELYHPIRIVPLHPGKAKAAAPQVAAQLTYRNGPLLTSVQVFTVFWGAQWNTSPQDALLTKVNQFFDFILTSQLLDQLGEYSVPNQTILQGSLIGTITLTSPDPGKTVDDSAIQTFLQQQISAGTLPVATANTLYFLFLPPGVTVTTSHELCEAITDPIPGQGWYDDNNGEIGDICAWQTRTLGGYTIQLEWSNAANRCL